MKDIYELLNEININEDEFEEVLVDDLEKKRLKKSLKSAIRKKTSFKKKIVAAASLTLILPVLFGVAFPSYAEKIPFFGDIFKYINREVEPIYENYKDYATPINITKESNGIKITLNEAIFDGTTLSYTYTIESNRDLTDSFFLGANSGGVNINEKYGGASGGDKILRTDGNTYVGQRSITFSGLEKNIKDSIKVNINWKDIAIFDGEFSRSGLGDKFEISGDIVEIIEGEWNFDIELNNISSKVLVVGKTEKIDGVSLIIDTITFSPINTKVEYTEKVDKKKVDKWVYGITNIEMEDDLGNKYVGIPNGGYGDNVSLTNIVTFNKINPKATKLIIKGKVIGDEMVNGVWDENRKKVEKNFEPIVIDLLK